MKIISPINDIVMKKIVFTAAIVVALGTVGYAIQRDGGQAPNDENLTQVQIENIEALGEVEGWIELGYTKNCLSYKDDVCCVDFKTFYYDSKPIYND